MNNSDSLKKIWREKFKNINFDLDIDLILADVLNIEREKLFTENFELTHKQLKKANDLLGRRWHYEPIAYLLHKKDFYQSRFFIDKGVLIPRPETEELVEHVLNFVNRRKLKNINIIDVGTGSGCIAISIAKELPNCQIFALENSKEAFEIAKINFEKFNLNNTTLIESNLLDNFHIQADIIVANLPYLSKSEMKMLKDNVSKYEPYEALYGGKDGLKYYRKLINQIKLKNLKPKFLIVEISPAQANYFVKSGFKIKKDLARQDRFAFLIN